MIKAQYHFLSTFLVSLIPVFGNVAAGVQDFREPGIQGPVESYLPADAIPIPAPVITGTSSPQLSESALPGFVPKATENGLGLVPVQPRAGSNSELESQQLRPTYGPGRSEEDARILDLIRSGNLDQTTPDGNSEPGPQTIRQRYPDGKVQLTRKVAQDENGNYYNEGPWQLFNRQGELIASGQFLKGVMDGPWERWHAAGSGGMFKTKPFTEFEGPFVSTATFRNGKLEDVWVISDRYQRKIVEVPYRDGKRNGTATWWHSNSQRMRSMNFKDDLLDGPLLEWDEKNQLVRNDEYIAGQKVIRVTSLFRPDQKSSETFFLDSQLTLDGGDSWWDAEPAEYIQNGSRVQHGPAAAWHSNGQKKMTGQYQNDVRVGRFDWWHENGTRALAGRFDAGRKVGVWTWWHDNGMKSIEGQYENDTPVGQWIWWDSDGKIRSQQDFGENPAASGVLVDPADTYPDTNGDRSGENDSDGGLKNNPPQSGFDQLEEIRPGELFERDDSQLDNALDDVLLEENPIASD